MGKKITSKNYVGVGKENKRSKLSELMSIDFFNGRKKRMMDAAQSIALYKNHSALPGETSIKTPYVCACIIRIS